MNQDTSSLPQPMPASSRLIITLCLIAMMSGFLVVLTFNVTEPRITQNKQEALEQAVFAVLSDATVRSNYLLDSSGLVALPDEDFARANVYAGYNEAGEVIGVAMEGSARGYQDIVRILYGYSLEKECIIGVTVLQSTETPGLGDRVETDLGFLANFDCLDASLNEDRTAMRNEIVTVKHGKKVHPWQVDGISGATITSKAVGNALRGSTSQMLPWLVKNKASLDRKKMSSKTTGLH
ncbi:MAG: FMN-binding protein [Candidatus Latescibacteria bacterium]|jgi:Na+-translocating ferredoxin:NAD+ oxidoreductase subunit G|nr:FMN-binding protein [Candidatus Latescibacterota bacterium]